MIYYYLLACCDTMVNYNAIKMIKQFEIDHGRTDTPLSGILVTGRGEIADEALPYIEEHKIPLVRTLLDTYGSVVKISKIEVKINRNTPWKISRAIELIQENVNLDNLLMDVEEK